MRHAATKTTSLKWARSSDDERLRYHVQQCDYSDNEQDLQVTRRVRKDNHRLVDDDRRLIRLKYMKKHRMKSHPMVLDIACQSVEFHCAVLQLVGAEIPYAVVPADASRWGLVVKLWSAGIPYALVPAVASRWGPIQKFVTSF